MATVLVGPVVGRVTDTTARILVEVSAAVDVTLLASRLEEGARASQSVTLSLECKRPTVFKVTDLEPDTSYSVVLEGVTGSVPSSFKTLPKDCNVEEASFAVVSCNKVFTQASYGGFIPEQADLWRHLASRTAAKELDVVIHIGDQVYGDSDWFLIEQGKKTVDELGGKCKYASAIALIEGLPPEDWPSKAQEIRDLYADVYRETWSHPPTREVLANVSNLMIFDDHELRDDWGDRDTDRDKSSATYFVSEQGYRVMLDYQHQLFEDVDSAGDISTVKDHLCMVLGKLGLLFLDVRGGRTFHMAGDEEDRQCWPLGSRQMQDIRDAFVGPLSSCNLLLAIAPVPLVYLSAKMNWLISKKVDDFEGHWVVEAHKSTQIQILDMLRQWKDASSARRLLLIGGDVHVGGNTTVFHDEKKLCEQLISSPIANKMSSTAEFFVLHTAADLLEGLGGGYSFDHHDWCRERNYGLLRVCTAGAGSIAWRLVRGDDEQVLPDEEKEFLEDEQVRDYGKSSRFCTLI
eukprot:gb/GFBE01010646.1/.p1 GENE.gb/GFBE01010646.1/~~gb/GFBE01010646.1/.p1  ORF type:complete len:518 (+),score=96.82 gb/GFBE01010646.1/:1-1554(+)